jgi:hypothetical protein
MIVDYTKHSPGIVVSRKGSMQRCPVCGHVGERRRGTAKSKPWLFVHRVTVYGGGQEPKVDKGDVCVSATPGDAPVPMTRKEAKRAQGDIFTGFQRA